ncbi:MAG TPA: cysteine--tRNA ligase [Acholeplasma sp.]|nr:cysteine--tRNA ligase [Acholeplasma sp.]
MLKIYNTQTRKTEEFKPINNNKVNMYVCGPTVYSDIHIGNARPVIFFDVLKNYLEFINYEVYYVSNITDVDDKIIEEAKKAKLTELELTKKYTKAFIEATNKVNSNLPDLMPKATNYIKEMVKYIKVLIDKGFAYQTESGVYFDSTKLSEYGSISNQNKEELEKSVRIENKGDKRDFKDFSLWKITDDQGIKFESPWGEGRPGWHTECAVMNHEIFNGVLDIHGGGSDLIFPHHENENIQTIAHSGHELSKYWMHVGRLDFGDEKMSKSLGNTVLVKDIDNGLAFRLLILAHHYRRPISFNNELFDEYIQIYDRITKTLKRTNLKLGVNFNQDEVDEEIISKFVDEMNNDLNTSNVITLILQEIKNLNKINDIIDIKKTYNSITKILNVLNIMPEYKLTKEIVNKYEAWEEARQNKDFDLADTLRKELSNEGWI